jgi:hypothetical protein
LDDGNNRPGQSGSKISDNQQIIIHPIQKRKASEKPTTKAERRKAKKPNKSTTSKEENTQDAKEIAPQNHIHIPLTPTRAPPASTLQRIRKLQHQRQHNPKKKGHVLRVSDEVRPVAIHGQELADV